MFLSKKSPELEGLSDEELKILCGGKGAGLIWMSQQGLNVPPFFVLPTTVWTEYSKSPKTVMKKIGTHVAGMLKEFKAEFGYVPLLSVRSGARVSCPGMMDTILNVGLDPQTESFWQSKLGAKCYADSFERLITMYGSVVKGLDRKALEDGGLPLYETSTREDFPDTKGQLLGSIEAVLKSWNNSRAKFYRKMNNIPEAWGTAVVVQAMVFGNLNDQSGTGVLFTRNPDTGENAITGEFLINAQGEDVVAGIRTPMALSEMKTWNYDVQKELASAVEKLEKARKDVQDVEFTIQDGQLFILQTRNAKRSARATIRIAVEMVEEKLLTMEEAAKRVTMRDFDLAQQAVISPKFKTSPIGTGIPACSGVVTGKPVFSSKDAIDCKTPCILITEETTPDDIEGMNAAIGVLTLTGGSTSHAAVVARGMNKPCVVGLGKDFPVGEFKVADQVSIDGGSGKVWTEKVPVIDGKNDPWVGKWQSMVCEYLKIVPITDNPKGKVGMLDIGMLTDGTSEFARIMTALESCDLLYLDISQNERSAAELSFCRMFPTTSEGEFIKTLEMMLLPEHKKKLQLITSEGVKTKLPVVGPAQGLESLIMAEGYLAITPGVQLSPAAKKVLKWRTGELQMVSLGVYTPGTLSMITPEAAMQVLTGSPF